MTGLKEARHLHWIKREMTSKERCLCPHIVKIKKKTQQLGGTNKRKKTSKKSKHKGFDKMNQELHLHASY